VFLLNANEIWNKKILDKFEKQVEIEAIKKDLVDKALLQEQKRKERFDPKHFHTHKNRLNSALIYSLYIVVSIIVINLQLD